MASPPAEPGAAAADANRAPAVPFVQELRRDQLDGLRALLFMCVFVAHHALERVEFFSYALPTFFVMSGFLITRVLWMCRAETLGGRLRTFYLRRIIRIVPAYAFVLALLLVFGDLQNPASYVFYYLNIKLFLVSLHQELPAYITWWSNWNTQNLHLWSVAVEEQFYIVFPFVYFLVPARYLRLAFALTVALGFASRTYFIHHYPTSFYGFLLTSCMEYFAWGALFAYRDLHGMMPKGLPPWVSIYVPVAAVVTLISIEYGFDLDGYFHQSTTQFIGPIAPLLGFAIWGIWTADRQLPLVRFLNWRPFVYLGQISYPMYLTHLTFIVFAERMLAGPIARLTPSPTGQALVAFAAALALTIAAGAAIWHAIEVPASRLKRYAPLGPARPARRAAPAAASSSPA